VEKNLLKTGAPNKKNFLDRRGGSNAAAQALQVEHFDLERALSLAQSLSGCLRGVHNQGELHLALCPANLYAGPDGAIELRNEIPSPLEYMSPEQSGRMNRGVDYRSDYYSLGVLLYELMTNRLPFEADNVMELIHSHIAKQPVAPSKLNPALPEAVDNIIFKLLSKNAEDRYQSLEGLQADLQQCRDALRDSGAVPVFSLGTRDICDRLQVPQKLYGREVEVAQIIGAFERIADGGVEMLLVTGYSGIGKSSLVNEIHKPVVARRGYLIAGKFDQLKRNIPYFAIALAFRDLIRQLLTESEEQIADWRVRILQAVGSNGQIMVDAIPELIHVIGEQSPVAQLGAAESQNRFNYVVQSFIGVFTRPAHPLIIFLDDLQWADAASLKLIQLIMNHVADSSLLLVGTYRDNEVEAGDPLLLTIAAIKQQSTVNEVNITPLPEASVIELVADTVKAAPENVSHLAGLIYRKTLGNPFFVGQFIKSLHNEQLLTFADGAWRWDIAQIEAMDITDNVVDLLARELDRLPTDTQRLLTYAACIGNRFDLKTLATVGEKSPEQARELLQPAVRAGLLIAPQADMFVATGSPYTLYRFMHDRVQQAAYAGVPENRRKAVHLKIGWLLFNRVSAEQRDERLFDIVQQLNEGRDLLEDTEQRRQLAELNLQAARKGKLTVAYETVLKHATAGIELLDNSAEAGSPLYFSLQLEQMEASFLTHRFGDVDRIGQLMLGYAGNNFQRALVHDVLIQSYLYQDRQAEGLALTYKALQLLGVEIPKSAGKLQVAYRYLKTRRLMSSRKVGKFLQLPFQMDPVDNLKQGLLSRAIAACYVASPAMFPILTFERVSIILKNGFFTPTLPLSLAGYAMALIQPFNSIAVGHEMGKLSLSLSRRSQASLSHAVPDVRVEFAVWALVMHWGQDLASTIAPLYENYQSGLQNGEVEYAAYSLVAAMRAELIMGRHLPMLLEKMQAAHIKITNLKQKTTSDAIAVTIGYAGALMGETALEARVDQQIEAGNPTRLTLFHWYLFRAVKAYILLDFELALDHIRMSETYLGSAACMATLPVYHLFHALSLFANFGNMNRAQRAEALAKAAALQKKLKLWSRHAPMNCRHKWQLVEAERYRVLGRNDRAVACYEQAARGARNNGFLSDEALANELAGNFYLALDKEPAARLYIDEARFRYGQWGAHAKVRQLERIHAALLPHRIDNQDSEAGSYRSNAARQLDMETVIRASQTLSEEIQLDHLLEKLMRLLVENAGAQKGILLLQKQGVLTVQARVQGEEIEVQQDVAATESADLSLRVVNYVRRTRLNVVLGDAAADTRFNVDPYIERNKPKSMLCIPLQKQSELVGILYLENNLAVDAFTPERTELLQILSTQIAISLENAGLYAELEHKVEMRTQALSQKNEQLNDTLVSLKKMQKQLVESEKLASLGQLVAGVAHEINTPVGVAVTGASTLAEETDKIESMYRDGSMRRSDLDGYMATAGTVSRLLLSNMERAAVLIQSFKEVAIDQTSEERRTFRLKAYIDDVLLNLRPLLRKTGHEVEVSCAETIEIDTYPGALSQVLTNFVMNALLHAFDQGKTSGAMAIVVREPDPASIELRFSDTGKGIPQELLPRIFDPFFTTARGTGGSGLGLNIVHNLVTGSLQGRIAVESTIGSGTTFVLNFPRNPAQRPPRRPNEFSPGEV
jgi:predicted ATPase/signal transduction histidine kinase